MFNIMNLNNIENIFYWTDNNGAVYLPGDTALTYRTKSDLPRFVAAVYSALNTDSGVSERVVTLNGHCGLLLGQQPRLNRFAGYRRGLRGNP